MKRLHHKILALLIGISIPFAVYAGLETGDFIDDLVITNPLGSDDASTADDHIRLIKKTIKATFPNITGEVTPTQTELNLMDGLTTAPAQIGASNTFTGSDQRIQNNDPIFSLYEADAGTDEKLWYMNAGSDSLILQTRTDAGASGEQAVNISRTGTNVDSISLVSDALTWDTNTLFTTANDGAGSGLDADLLDGFSSAEFPRLAASNTFTGSQQRIENNDPIYSWYEADAGVDEKLWFMNAGSDTLRIQTRTDVAGAGSSAIVISRSGTTVTSIALSATNVTSNGDAVATVSDSGTFTATHNGFSSSVTSTGTYRVAGGIACVHVAPTTGTSNATTYSITGMPAAARPVVETGWFTANVTDNTTSLLPGGWYVATSGEITLLVEKSDAYTGWTASGGKGLTASRGGLSGCWQTE